MSIVRIEPKKALYLTFLKTLEMEPVRKIRVYASMLIGSREDNKNDPELDLVYRVAISLEKADYTIPWAFELSEENYNKYIKPWLKRFPSFFYMNDLDKMMKEEKMKNMKEWEKFFYITTNCIDKKSIEELKTQFLSAYDPIITYRFIHLAFKTREIPIGIEGFGDIEVK